MSEAREFHIDDGINYYVNTVYTKAYYLKASQELRAFIQGKSFQIDYNAYDDYKYLPSYDGLYYPTVSNTKVSDEYDEADRQKFEDELVKIGTGTLPTFQYYYVKRLNNELCHYLKMAFQAALYPHELNSNFAFDLFVKQFKFIIENIKDATIITDYKSLWLNVLENLKNDPCVKRMGFDGNFYPLGNYLIDSIRWIIERILI